MQMMTPKTLIYQCKIHLGLSKNYVKLILVIVDSPPPYVMKRNVSVSPPPLSYVTNHKFNPPPRDLSFVSHLQSYYTCVKRYLHLFYTHTEDVTRMRREIDIEKMTLKECYSKFLPTTEYFNGKVQHNTMKS